MIGRNLEKITINASCAYEVIVGENLLDISGKLVKEVVKGKKAFILTDDVVEKLYYKKVKESLEREGFELFSYVIESGEKSKCIGEFEKVLIELAKNKLTRADFLIALGGGVVGDLGGFVASVYMRGIDYVQIPTTLLSQIDSSVGGKTAIDLAYGKNLVGTFHQPKLVLADITTLTTLSEELIKDGLGEMAKYAVMDGGQMFEIMQSGRHRDNLFELICQSIKMKRDIVEEDEKENGVRVLLNLGHTIAHSIEKLSKFTIRHGIAVGIGIFKIARACEKNGLLRSEDLERILSMLSNIGLKESCPYLNEQLVAEFDFDKKSENDNISLVVIRGLGKVEPYKITLRKAKEFFN